MVLKTSWVYCLMHRQEAFEWPSGYRSAVCLSWDMDGESAYYARNPEDARKYLSELSQRSFGPEVGIWKVLDMLDGENVPGSFYIPGYTARIHPDAAEAIRDGGHAIGLHGYMHELMDVLDGEQEERMMDLSAQSLKEVAGTEPYVFRSPSFELNRRTPELLVRKGVRSDSSIMGDEFPYAIKTEAGPLIELPVQWILDDAEFWGHTKANRSKPIIDPETVFRIWKREFDGIHENGGLFVLTMHPFISGRWVYIDVIRRLINHIKSRNDVWIATTEEVTDYSYRSIGKDFMVERELPPTEPLSFE